MQDCGTDAHQHVPNCAWNTVRQGHFASEAQYRQMLNARVTKVLEDYLNELTREQRQHALEDIQGALRHRELDPRQFRL